MTAEARVLVDGEGRGQVVLLSERLSFWGGVDPTAGRIVDRHHPQRGRSVAGRVLAMPGGRGSTSSSTVLAECIRRGTGPVAIILLELDPILAIGAAVARELYGVRVPVVVVERARFDDLRDGETVEVTADARTMDVRRA